MTQRRIRAKVTIEETRILILRPMQEPLVRPCPVCRRQATMVIPEEAARRLAVSTRTVYRRMDTGIVHFVEGPGGDVLVCLNSISKTEQKKTEDI